MRNAPVGQLGQPLLEIGRQDNVNGYEDTEATIADVDTRVDCDVDWFG
ncbi:hypothetical protein [Aporhodopirellula aestuarii]|uniref:Uncharacterized protein n=1 Tax=Aporhodopirellula aestuarii TaxID=2950107 RepID=A0ABT0UAE5_9BACT|nr:hypothetical protein [Aporhodopirellula aestuarii]MCM2373969.1 hypothetical protein [Aporhodopirellula aestuarii]